MPRHRSTPVLTLSCGKGPRLRLPGLQTTCGSCDCVLPFPVFRGDIQPMNAIRRIGHRRLRIRPSRSGSIAYPPMWRAAIFRRITSSGVPGLWRNAGRSMMPIFGPIRPAFLVLTPACVALGMAVANLSGTGIRPVDALLVSAGALAAHVAVNALNEYFDFRSGLDFRTRRTPFSGGSGTLPQHPEAAPTTLAIGLAGVVLIVGIGAYFVALRGPALLVPGLIGLLLVLLYTPWVTRRPWLCLIAPGLGFGPCMVIGSEIALTGGYSAGGLAASLVPFFLVNNLLLLNQLPDVEADRSVGRKTVPMRVGRRGSVQIYAWFLLLAALSLGTGIYLGDLPLLSLLGAAGLCVAVPVIRGLGRQCDRIEDLQPLLALNVAASVSTPALLALGIFLSGL